MADYHTVYKDIPGTTTEWEDLQVKYGNFQEREKPEKAERWVPAAESVGRRGKDWIDSHEVKDLEEAEDELEDDRFLEEYRRKRITELQETALKPRFGSVEQIRGQDFVREVSQAPNDVWVVVHLFKDGIRECSVLSECLDDLAEKYPGTKFVKIVSTDCIKNYPDFNLPTLIVYNSSKVQATLVGMKNFGGQRCTPEDVAFTLCKIGPVLVGSGGEGPKHMQEKVAKDYVRRLVARQEEEYDNDDDSDD